MKQNKRKTGARYEQMAGEYLKMRGYEILMYNFRCRTGEIDIIAKDGDCIVFCEVKYRQSQEKGHPLEAVGEKKQKVLSACALYYIMTHPRKDVQYRFDVIGILKDETILVQNAFEIR